ncbi:MAG: peptide ABC transporter substrate-binding protein [Chloroflexota bacterium]|nr:peptide ABC transporter substrate-binding protein [Chloroflexota bacterium]
MNRSGRASRTFAVVPALALVVLASGCGSSSPGASSSPSTGSSNKVAAVHLNKGSAGTLRWWNNYGDTWVKSFDPPLVTDSVSIGNVNLIYANLVKTNYPNLKPIPDLATWNISKNHKFYTFHLRHNARFSNGDPVTAADALWSINRALAPSTKSTVATTYLGAIHGAMAVNKGKARSVSGIRVLNRYTLQIRLDQPIAYFLGALSYPTADVLDKRVMQGKPAASYLTNRCMGNVGAGPFKLSCQNSGFGKSSFYPGGHSPYVKYVPNPYYYGKKARINIIAPFFGKVDDEYRDYEAGGLDGTNVPPSDIPQAQSKPGYTNVPGLITDYITPNEKVAPFNNLHCRLAVAYAIDRDNITRKLLRGFEGPLYDVLPPGLPGYFGRQSTLPYYDPARATKELSQCPGGLHNIALTFQNTSTDTAHEYDAVRANLASIGATITLKPLTFNAWLGIVTVPLTTTKTAITENLWLDDYPDPQDWMSNLLQTGAAYDIGGFSDPTFDNLVNKGNVEFNPGARARDYAQASRIALSQGAWIGVGFQDNIYIFNPRVHGMINTGSLSQPRYNDWSNVTVSG